MKNFLLNLIFIFALMLTRIAAFAQPVISYAGNSGANTYIFPLNTAIATQTPTVTGTPVGTFGALANFSPVNTATGVTYGSYSGKLFAIDYADGNLYSITLAAASTAINTANIPVNVVAGVAQDGLGNIFTSDKTKVQEFSPTGALLNTFTGFTYTAGITVDASNNVWVADNGAGSVVKLAAGTFAKTTLTTIAGAYGIAVNNTSGDIYVSSSTANTITRIIGGLTGGNTTMAFASGFNTPCNLTIDAAGNIYVADSGNNAIKRITPSGTNVTILSAGMSSPKMVTFDPSGNLYEADYNNGEIKKSAGTYYSYTGTLPPGLSFNAYTGAFTGTPTTTGTYPVVVTAASTSGNSTPVTVTFYCGQTTLTYPTPNIISLGSAASILPTFSNGYPTSANAVSVSPPGILLSSLGLGFDAHQGIVGTPSTIFGPITFDVTATNAAGTTTSNIFSISCVAPPAFSYAGPYTFTTGSAITAINPTVTSGGPIVSATISPALPTGLSMDAAGNITGTPTVVSPTTTYTISGKNSNGGIGTATVVITCNPPTPTISYAGSPYSYTVGTAITSLTPVVTNAPTSYSISPNITTNTGLAFSTTSGIISGNPTTASTPVTYTITATNAGGSGTTTISVQVYPKVPTVAYAGSPYIYYNGGTITTLTPTTTNSPTSFSISPDITTNTGLTFSTTTGQISGTPTTVTGAVTYTITATNANPTPGTTTISITILGPPTISYTGSPYTYTVGTAITSLTPAVTNAPTSYSISPSITTNTGLAFSTTTGVISGTPTTASTPVTYTITATNPAGSNTTTISVQVYPKSPTIAYTGSPYTYYNGVAITTLTPTTTNTPTSYSISPNLTTNTGLSFSTTTGQISGTPTIASGAVTYTITATNANPTSGTTTISITVLDPPTISYTGSPYTYTVGTAITSLTPATTNSPTSYSISPSITTNTGLAFSTSTGVISGTPTTASTPVTYTITATNAGGSGTTTISVQVYPKSPTIAYTGSPFTYYNGGNITTLTPTTTNSPTSFSISPNLTTNTGLSFSTTTGQISGTPTTVTGAVTYTITATNANPTSGTTTISITILGPPTISYTGSPYTYTVGTAITSLTPAVTNAPTSYSISPSITTNTGLAFSTTTGVISGTPTTASTPVTYTITATNPAGSNTTTISVQVYPKSPTIAYTGSPYTYYNGVAITTLTPTTTNTPTSYSISPNLTTNTGLSFSTTTGQISGTPTIASGAVTYTITATNANPTSGTTTISITVLDPPTISYTGSPYTYTVGTAITSLTPATTNSPTSYSISPSITTNTGLAFSTSTGVISGTPTTASTPVTYTITATNAGGSGTTTISVQVYPKSPTIAYTGSPFTYYNGGNITTLTPTTTNSPTSFSISPNLTTNTGLSFSTTTGQISGTPTTVTGAVTYTITATNANPTSGTTTISITILGPPTISYTGSPYTYTVGTAITSLTPAVTNAPTSYSISPSITTNTGLAFSTSTGVISGTPTTASTPVTYTITATNPAGSNTTTISVQVYPKSPTVAYAGSPYTYYTSAAITTLTPTTTNTPTSFSISPDVTANTGLSFSTTTGQISGTPTIVSGAVTYTITATNANPTPGTTTISITILGPPTISYTPSSYTDTVGYATTPVAPIVTNSPTTYSISPNLTTNTGLVFNTTNGTISGTPTTLSAAVTYTVTATNAGGSATTTITFTCVNPPPPALAYTPNYYSLGLNATVSFTVTNSGGPVAGNYTISPTALPAGLTFNAATGTISGTTTTTASAVTYTVTGTNGGGIGTATITIGVSTQAIAFDYNPNSYTLNVGTPVPTSILPEISAGAPTSGYGYSTGTVILTSTSTPAPLTKPLGMAEDASGNLYVVNNTTPGTITEYSTTGTVSLFGTGATYASAPIGIVFDSSGNAYVLTASNIYVFNSSGVYQPGITFTGISGAVGICIDQSNNLYVAYGNTSSAPNTVVEFPNTGGVGTTVPLTVGGNKMTGGIAVDGNGYLYVVDANNKRIDIYNPFQIGSTPTTLSIGVNTVYGVSVDPGDNIYVSYTGKVAIYSQTSGTPTLALTLTGFNSPRGTVTDNSGNLYVSDYSANTVTKYTQVAGYYITSTLAAGLTFDNTSGLFSGTPSANFTATYTVIGFNSSGSGSTTISFNCNTAGPTIYYSPNTYVFAQNVASPTITPISTGSYIPSAQEYYVRQPIFTASTTPAASGPWGMAYDPTGNVYVVNYTSKNVMKYNPVTQAISTFITTATYTATGAGAPIGIAFDPSGNADILTANGVYQFNSSGVYQSEIITGFTGGTGITISLYNNSYNIYVANSTTDIVARYALTGGTGTTVASGFAITGGVAVDGSGDIYVADGNFLYEYSNTNTYISRTNYGAAINGVYIDGSNNIFATTNTTNWTGSSTNQAGYIYYLDTDYSSARGILTDKYGNMYVSDYGANAVYIYTPYNGYYLSGGPLPAGLSFNNATGQFTGTPTTIFSSITFTVTAWNSIGSSSTPITFTCLQPLNWVGTTSNDWNTGSNWVGGSVPTSTQTAYIGATAGSAYSYSVIPTISASENISVGSIILGTQNTNFVGPGIVVNGTLTTPTITYQGDSRSSSNGYTAALSGTGTINTGNITVNANYAATGSYTEAIQSSVSNMTINNSITLTSTRPGNKNYNATYNITGGIVNLNGIVTTNNGSANNTSTLTVNNATLNIGHPIALSGLSTTGTNVVTFNGTNTTVNYTGSLTQTFYTDAGVSTSTGGVTYTNIGFSNVGIKNPNAGGGNLSLTGNFTNTLANDANDYIMLTATPVLFTGTTETLAGGPGSTAASPTSPGNGTVFSSVTFSGNGTKTIASGVFHVSATGLLTMSGNSASTILDVATGGNLTLNSSLYGSATVTAMTGPSITGSVDVQRYLSGGSSTYRGYRMLSSPVTSGSNYVSINYLIKSCYMTATTGSSAGFDGGLNPTLYLFRENLVPSNATFTSGNFRGVNNITAPPVYGIDLDSPPNYHIPVGNGYLFFFRGDRSVASFTAETNLSYVPTATTLTATGTLNQGAITYNNWFSGSGLLYSTISGTPTVEGYNLVGNPYASSIDWDKSTSGGGTGIVTTHVNPFIYIIDPVSKNYNVYKAGNGGVGNIATANSNIIASGQGFFVVANSTGASLTFNESAKSNTQVASGNRNLFMGVPPIASVIPTIHLCLVSDSIVMDGTVINFDNNAKPQYLSDVDAPHKVGFGTTTLACRSTDSVALAYYTLPFPKSTQKIPLNVYASIDGTYQLNRMPLQNIPELYDIWLMDAYAKDSLDMKHNPSYSFTVINSDTNSFGKNRFSLVLRQNPALMVHLLSFTATKVTPGDQVVWTTENEQNYTNFVVQRSTDGGKTFTILDGFVSSAQGTYSYLDKTPVIGANSYRLQLTDLNGTITYSNIVTIMYANTGNQIAINGMMLYPNPTSSTVNLAIDQSTITQAPGSPATSYNIQIINNLGSVIKTAVSSQPNWQTDVSTLVPGTYFIRVTNASTNSVVGKSAFVKL